MEFIRLQESVLDNFSNIARAPKLDERLDLLLPRRYSWMDVGLKWNNDWVFFCCACVRGVFAV